VAKLREGENYGLKTEEEIKEEVRF